MSNSRSNVRCQNTKRRIDTTLVSSEHSNITWKLEISIELWNFKNFILRVEMDVDCGYCYDRIRTDDFLECEECEQYVHVKCLRRPGTPGDFVG